MTEIFSSPVFWSALIGASGPVLIFFSWLFSKRHTEEVADQDSMATAMTAITNANVNITSLWGDLMAPVNIELESLRNRTSIMGVKMEAQEDEISTLRSRHDALVSDVSRLNGKITLLVSYIRQMRRQITETGHEPHPPPPELDNFSFD